MEKFKRRAGDGVLKVREMAEERLDTVPRFRDSFGSSSLIRSPATDHSWDLTQETGTGVFWSPGGLQVVQEAWPDEAWGAPLVPETVGVQARAGKPLCLHVEPWR